MITYCANPRCDNRCGRKPPDNLTEGIYAWADFCEPPSFVCLGVAEEDEADPDEPTDSELADVPDLPPLPESHDVGGSD